MSLSYWKVNRSPILRSWELWFRFYWAPFRFSSTLTSLPVASTRNPPSRMVPRRWWAAPANTLFRIKARKFDFGLIFIIFSGILFIRGFFFFRKCVSIIQIGGELPSAERISGAQPERSLGSWPYLLARPFPTIAHFGQTALLVPNLFYFRMTLWFIQVYWPLNVMLKNVLFFNNLNLKYSKMTLSFSRGPSVLLQ